MNYLSLLNQYKSLIDFNDKMEKDNFKYIDRMVRSKKFNDSEKISILKDAIDLQTTWMNYKKSIKLKFEY